MPNSRYSYQILVKFDFSREVFKKILKYEISRQSIQWGRVVLCGKNGVRTHMMMLNIAFCNFSKEPKIVITRPV
jgi:hypothetical protein